MESFWNGVEFTCGVVISGVACFLVFLLFLEIMEWIRKR